jgi:curli biogenesis system outer membrane secretion channel CsgG
MKKIISILAVSMLAVSAIAATQPSPVPPIPADETPAKSAAGSTGLLQPGTNNVVIREVTGRGRNRDEAIKSALYGTVQQVRGVNVGSGAYEFRFNEAGASISSPQPAQRDIGINSIDISSQGTVYTTEIAGIVKGYDILKEEQIDQNTYQVTMSVSVYDYAARGQTGRVKVALMPVKAMQKNYTFLDQSISADTLCSLLYERLAAGLTQTNKFAVLDRQSISDFAAERKMLLSFDAPLSEQAKLIETLGGDYLLTGTITQAFVEKTSTFLKAANYTTIQYKARFDFTYKLVDSATKQIVLASTSQKYLEDEQVRNLADEQDPSEWNSSQVRDAFLALAVNDIINAVIDKVYPVKIIEVQQDGQIILNQGGEKITQGMTFDVFAQGSELFDPDTKESLGQAESYVATIEIIKTAQTISYAKLISGNMSQLSKGLVCRIKSADKPADTTGSKPNVIRNETGGVKLPFDR